MSCPTIPVYWPLHAPAKIKRDYHFGVLTGMWIFQPTERTQGNQLWKPTGQNWTCVPHRRTQLLLLLLRAKGLTVLESPN